MSIRQAKPSASRPELTLREAPCCDPVCCAPLDTADASDMAGLLKALGDPTRLRLFSLIAAADEMCACDLTAPLGVSQPTVSHHLRMLTEAGLVAREQRGKWAFYTVDRRRLAELSAFLDPTAEAATPKAKDARSPAPAR